MAFIASYRHLFATGELRRRAEHAWQSLESCTLCPHDCGTNRLAGELGRCRASAELRISHHGPHFGEEDCFRGSRGAGTIFFGGCSFSCVFCQNYEISQGKLPGRTYTVKDLARAMLELQAKGCHNLDLVTPTHYLPHILAALDMACRHGLNLPLVYNSNAYENDEGMALLDGVVDIYLPDFKWGEDGASRKYSRIPGSVQHVAWSIAEMWRQVGQLQLSDSGIAWRGMLIRHLVMPNGIAASEAALSEIADSIGTDVHVSLMSQYYVANKAQQYDEINRRITVEEYEQVVEVARDLGFMNLLLQASPVAGGSS